MATGNTDFDGTLTVDPPVFKAVIRPHRSLAPNAFAVLMGVCGLATLFAGSVFVAFGLWPVAGFFGLDLLALYIAFRVNFRDGRSVEEIVLTRFEFLCRRVTHRERQEWRFNPLWMRMHREHKDDEFGLLRLAVTSRGQRVVIARDLSPSEREELADELGRALGEVKRGY
jgi:uncharacterized membrane protein